jgi:hypothetical protein
MTAAAEAVVIPMPSATADDPPVYATIRGVADGPVDDTCARHDALTPRLQSTGQAAQRGGGGGR